MRHGRRKVNVSGGLGLSVAILGMGRLDSFCIAMVMSVKASVIRSPGLEWFGIWIASPNHNCFTDSYKIVISALRYIVMNFYAKFPHSLNACIPPPSSVEPAIDPNAFGLHQFLVYLQKGAMIAVPTLGSRIAEQNRRV